MKPRQCQGCGSSFPSFEKTSKYSVDRRVHCKDCKTKQLAENSQRHYAKNKETLKKRSSARRKERRESDPIFATAFRAKDAARQREKRRADPIPHRLEVKAWNRRNPEKKRAIGRRSSAKLRARQRADGTRQAIQKKQNALAYAKHKVRMETDREYEKKFLKGSALRKQKWAKKNPEQTKAQCRRRRARKMGAEGSHTTEEWIAFQEKYDYRCLNCGRRKGELDEDGKPIIMTEEHIEALSLGGSDYMENIQLLCKPCNSRKGKKATDYRLNPHPLCLMRMRSVV